MTVSVDLCDMLKNFCFHVYAQKSLFIGLLDWPTQTKTYLINVNARILIIYMKIMNSVASFLGDTFEKCLRSRGHYFLDLTLFWNRR